VPPARSGRGPAVPHVPGRALGALVAAAALVAVAALTLAAGPGASPAGATPSQSQPPTGHGVGPGACVSRPAGGTDAWDCLPFYRWADDADSFYSNYGASEIGKASVMQPLVTFLYGMAGLIWQILQWLTRTALAFDLFTVGGTPGSSSGGTPAPLQPVNDGYAAVADLALSGVGLLILALAVVVVATRLARDGERSARDLIRPFACLAVLLVLLARAGPDDAGGARTGSPGWLAERGVGVSNVVADRISGVAPRAGPDDAPDNLLDCQYYVEEMRRAFDGGGDRGATGTAAFQPRLASLMSSLWEASYLDLWTEAQFGSDDELAGRAYCRMLEDRERTPPGDQAAIQAAAMAGAGASVPAAGTSGSAPFGRFNDDKDFRRGMIAWAVCGWYRDRGDLKEEADGRLVPLSGPGFAVNPEFRLMWNLGSPPAESRASTCSGWWGVDGSGTTKPDPRGTKWGVRDGDGPFQFGTARDIDEAFTVYGPDEVADVTGGALGANIAPYAAADRENLPDARDWVFALNGHNLSNSVPHAFLAIIIAGIYLWAIGGLALGTLVAQFLTVLFFVALPLLLVVGMWPSEGARRLFWRYTRIGIGSLFAKAAFVTLLAVLLLLIGVIDALGARSGAFGAVGGDGGLGAAMLEAAAPVAAIWAMRWALKDLGMGNIFSLKGAMALTGRLVRGGQDGAPGPDGAPGQSFGQRTREAVRRRLDRRAMVRDLRRGGVAGGEPGAKPGAKDPRPGRGAAAKAGDAATKNGEAARKAERTGPRARGAALLRAIAHPGRFNPEAVRNGDVADDGEDERRRGPLAGARFGFAAAAAAATGVATWAAGRHGRAGQRDGGDLPADHGRAPTADEMGGVAEGAIGAAYGRHVEAIAAAGTGADLASAARHPDITAPALTTGREVTEDGAVHAVTSTRRSVPLPTPGWAARDGAEFAEPRGYRGHHRPPPDARAPRGHRRRHLPGGTDDHDRPHRAGRH
jgi:hypothetical protein